MATNDILLVDKLLVDFRAQRGISDIGDSFERFALIQYLKDLDPTDDELEAGTVDGRDDSGIDAWFIVVDGNLLGDGDAIRVTSRTPRVDVYILTAKHHDAFRMDPVTNLCAAVDELFDLRKSDSELTSRYNELVLGRRTLLREVLITFADRQPQLCFHFAYLSRGDESSLDPAIRQRSERTKEVAQRHFGNATVSFEFFGASSLLAAFRKIKDFSARLPYEGTYLSRGRSNYLFLARLSDLWRLASDSDGTVKQHLFESNVRDYVGRHTFVNSQMLNTLRSRTAAEQEDFWWLNNGVTIIATDVNVVGKEIFLKNLQIVNGLQTTHTIAEYFAKTGEEPDDRCVLVKVIVTDNKELSDRIILATNSQEKVDSASLRATDKIQRDIEQLLESHGWYYNRRKHFQENRGRPSDRIISIRFMSYCTVAICCCEPFKAGRSRPVYMHDDAQYEKVFSPAWDLRVFLAVLEITRGVENGMRTTGISYGLHEPWNYTSVFRFLYASLYVQKILNARGYHPNMLVPMIGHTIDLDRLLEVHTVINRTRVRNPSLRRLHRCELFYAQACKELHAPPHPATRGRDDGSN